MQHDHDKYTEIASNFASGELSQAHTNYIARKLCTYYCDYMLSILFELQNQYCFDQYVDLSPMKVTMTPPVSPSVPPAGTGNSLWFVLLP